MIFFLICLLTRLRNLRARVELKKEMIDERKERRKEGWKGERERGNKRIPISNINIPKYYGNLRKLKMVSMKTAFFFWQ
jgi:hypothetical protein